MKIILTRHGHVEGIEPERFRGRLDLALTELGRRQADATAKRIAASWRPSAIYTSPMSRCIMTGAAIGALVNLRPSPDGLLNDFDYGEWLGHTLDEVRTNWPRQLAIWHHTPDLAVVPKGESLQAMSARVAAALHNYFERHASGVIVIVGHDSINRVLLLQALDLPLSHYWRIKQDPCAISELDFEDYAFTVKTLNETWHLRTSERLGA